jgi:putative flavoprotein involved in K+ transport
MLETTTNLQVTKVLGKFDEALQAEDAEAAAEVFQDDCYWRDLVSFTWNIKTMEGKAQVHEMLEKQLAHIKPSNWEIAEGELASEEDGVITAWITFETAVARGYGLIRVRDGKIWTLLTTMVELKGHEEAKGFDRPLGAKHGAEKNRPTWKE